MPSAFVSCCVGHWVSGLYKMPVCITHFQHKSVTEYMLFSRAIVSSRSHDRCQFSRVDATSGSAARASHVEALQQKVRHELICLPLTCCRDLAPWLSPLNSHVEWYAAEGIENAQHWHAKLMFDTKLPICRCIAVLPYTCSQQRQAQMYVHVLSKCCLAYCSIVHN